MRWPRRRSSNCARLRGCGVAGDSGAGEEKEKEKEKKQVRSWRA
jgi:hypothetical protein